MIISSYNDKFSSTFEEVDITVNKICKWLSGLNKIKDAWEVQKLDYALRELFNNAVEHGNKSQKDKHVCFSVSFSQDTFIIDVFDHGEGFDIGEVVTGESLIDRDRKRGLESLLALDFKIHVFKGHVKAILDLGYLNCIETGC